MVRVTASSCGALGVMIEPVPISLTIFGQEDRLNAFGSFDETEASACSNLIDLLANLSMVLPAYCRTDHGRVRLHYRNFLSG